MKIGDLFAEGRRLAREAYFASLCLRYQVHGLRRETSASLALSDREVKALLNLADELDPVLANTVRDRHDTLHG